MNQFRLHVNFQTNDVLLDAMDRLTQKTFDFSFKSWREKNYWNSTHIPYAFFDQSVCIAAVMVSIFDFTFQQQEKRYIQLGTVMCDEAYRKQGLTRKLIEIILAEWKTKCAGIFLYANDDVLNFYPRFGFIKEREYHQSCTIPTSQSLTKRLNVNRPDDGSCFKRIFSYGNPYTSIQLHNHKSIIMFHLLMYLHDHVYYLPAYDAIVIAVIHHDTMYCYDIYAKSSIDMKNLLSGVGDQPYSSVIFGFPVLDKFKFSSHQHNDADTNLFVYAKKENIFHDHTIMFPLICHT